MTDAIIPYTKFVEIRQRRLSIAADFTRRSADAMIRAGRGHELPLALDCVGVTEPSGDEAEVLPLEPEDNHGGRLVGIGFVVARPSRAIVDL